MTSKTLNLTEPLYQYLLQYGVRELQVMQDLRAETAKLPTAMMQISPEQGQFMHFMTKLLKVKNALEIGTFTGYSALAVATALPADGKLIACDQSEEWTNIAKDFWQRANVADKIELRLAPALESWQKLVEEKKQFDLIFIDADKVNYNNYYDYALKLLSPNGLIMLDNVFFGGTVADPDCNLPATRAIRALNERLVNDVSMDVCMIPVGDGITLVQKK